MITSSLSLIKCQMLVIGFGMLNRLLFFHTQLQFFGHKIINWMIIYIEVSFIGKKQFFFSVLKYMKIIKSYFEKKTAQKWWLHIYWPLTDSVNGSTLILEFGLFSESSKSFSSSLNNGWSSFVAADAKKPCNVDLNGNPLIAISTPTESKSSKLICLSFDGLLICS